MKPKEKMTPIPPTDASLKVTESHDVSPEIIEVIGARTHNLKNVSCRIRRGKFTVITGVSGSGKSSLAFDTLYAEGQRRYVESLSTYARQFLEKIQRPDVDAIHGIPPAIALEQKNSVTNARSTIGTATEVNDFLRLMFARVGHLYCPDCGVEVSSDTPQSAIESLAHLPAGTRLIIIAPVRLADASILDSTLAEMRRQGFTRAMGEGGEFIALEEFRAEHLAVGTRRSGDLRSRGDVEHLVSRRSGDLRSQEATPSACDAEISLIADRVAVGDENYARLAEALELAFRAGEGKARVRDADSGAEWVFSAGLACNQCGRVFRKPEPGLFSFSSPLGACPKCQGFGRVIGIDMDKVIPNWDLTLNNHPIIPWNTPANLEIYPFMEKTAPSLPWTKPLKDFTKEQKNLLIEGHGEWIGVRGFFEWLEGRRYKVQARVMLARYRAYTPCPDCGGTRLVPDALCVKVDGHNIAQILKRTISDLHEYFDLLHLPEREQLAAERLISEIRSRLHFLDGVGLGYLTLDRQTRTLSGGESQRINLATALGSALTETLYVLDEPTVGLHSRDTFRLLAILQALRERGNTVVVVEHDPDIILGADDVIDMGPASGDLGGEILYAGSLQGLARSEKSITAKTLARSLDGKLPSQGRKPTGWITVRGARENNLKNLDVRFPRGVFCCVTGVSGSGKSTLVHSILYAGFRRMREGTPIDVGNFDRMEGAAALEDILLVDQKPIGRSTRSNPVTYVKAYDEIRKVFASTREANRAGIKAGDFSFNIAGGRCETCEGAGVVTIDMHFLADVEVTCDTCDGKRFQRRVLEIEWHGKNVDDVLAMTVNEAQDFFAFEPRILKGLAPLDEVGLGYLTLGQSTATLSGGEAQRLKLAGFLANRTKADNIVMIFDEPTTGLHQADTERLTGLFQTLVDRGVSLIIIEHNLDLIAHADWIIDLGPEGGRCGREDCGGGPAEEGDGL